MKKRKGFVSNSSTSSFVILKKDDEMSFEDRVARSVKEITAYCDFGDNSEKIEMFVTKPAKEYAKKGQHIVMRSSIDWNAQADLDDILPEIFVKLGIDTDIITIEWVEE